MPVCSNGGCMMTISSFLERLTNLNNGARHDDHAMLVRRNVWWDSDSTPTSTILLIAFNMASAGLLMATVFFDMWKASRKNGSLRSDGRQTCFDFIRPSEVLTLSFTAAVLVQGVVLVIIQSMQLSPSIGENCDTSGQILFPALWIVGLVILVFGVKTLYRGFQKNRFAPRKKMALYISWTVVALLTLFTWIPTAARRSTFSKCRFGLLTIVIPWSDVALVITIVLIVLYTLIASLIATQLLRSRGIDAMERLAATQMVYYLAIATAVFTFFLPFWVKITLQMPRGITPMMAVVSINVIGIVVSFFQLLFRSYTESMTIGHEPSKKFRGDKGLKRKISSPIPIPQGEYTASDSGVQKEPSKRRSYFRRMNIDKSLPPTPTARQKSTNPKASYSIFPTKASSRRPRYPASSIYEDDIFLIPPRPAFAAHNRNSSEISHATVQIGFRLSNLDPPPAPRDTYRESKLGPAMGTASRTDSRFLSPQTFVPNANNNHISTTSLKVPITLRSPATERPDMTFPPPSASIPSSSSPQVSRARSSTQPTPTPTITSARPRSPAVYRKLDNLQKMLEVDLQAAQRAAADHEAWPLRNSLPDILPKSTYHPDE